MEYNTRSLYEVGVELGDSVLINPTSLGSVASVLYGGICQLHRMPPLIQPGAALIFAQTEPYGVRILVSMS
jgi:hypothetical protein